MLGLPGQLLNFRNSIICSPRQRNIAACPRRQGAECLSLLTLVATINVHATVPTLLGFVLSHVAHCIGGICKLVRQEGERRHAYSGWIFKFNPRKVSVCLANTTNNVIRIRCCHCVRGKYTRVTDPTISMLADISTLQLTVGKCKFGPSAD